MIAWRASAFFSAMRFWTSTISALSSLQKRMAARVASQPRIGMPNLTNMVIQNRAVVISSPGWGSEAV